MSSKQAGNNQTAEAGVVFFAPPEPELIARLPGPVVLMGADPQALQTAMEKHPDKVLGLEYTGEIGRVIPKLLLSSRELLILVDDDKELIRHYHLLPKVRVMARITPGKGLLRRIKTTASLKIPLDLLPLFSAMEPDQAAGALEMYLHEKSLESPLEPFHSILQSLMNRAEIDLWRMAGMDPQRMVYLDAAGNAAISRDDLSAGRFMGAWHDGPLIWRQSPVFREVVKFRMELPQNHADCLECRFFAWCRAWARYVDGKPRGRACANCLAVFPALKSAQKKLVRLQARMAKKGMLAGDNKQGFTS
jgi:hypothetical protein